jgi:hypothetical protein
MTPNKIETNVRQLELGSSWSWDHWSARPNNFYEFCSVILVWTVTKNPPTYDT